MPNDPRGGDLTRCTQQQTDLTLPNLHGLDVSQLPEEQRNALVERAAQTQIDLAKRKVELDQDLDAMSTKLESIASNVGSMTEKGVSSTVTNRQQDNLGTMEIIAGNTEMAKQGKMPRSVSGEFNWTPVLVILGIVAIVVIVVVVANR